ncbi:MAG: peptidylprolyl isomerase [Caldilineales bacterium]|nr:peptidylprolyl isomerase [Caldilineales bacterium]
MSKQSRKQQEEAKPEEPRRHRRLRQQDAQNQRRVLIALGIALGLVAVLLLAGIVYEYGLKPNQPVAEVNGQAISTSEFQRRLRFEQDNLLDVVAQYIQFGQQFGTDGNNPFESIIQQQLGVLLTPERQSLDVVDTMTTELLVRQLAAEQGISVSEDDVQLDIESQFGYERNPEPTPTPDPAITNTVPAATPMTAEGFLELYNETVSGQRDRGSLNEVEFRETFSDRLLRERLQAAIPLEVATTEEQVHASHILISTEPVTTTQTAEEADAAALVKVKEVQDRLAAGEDFATLAEEYSDDTGSASQGGDLGWFGRGRMVAEFEDAAFSQEVGVVGEPVKSQFGYHIILVQEKDPARPLDEAEIERRRNTAFDEWLQAQIAAAAIVNNWSPDMVPPLPDDITNIVNSLTTGLPPATG